MKRAMLLALVLALAPIGLVAQGRQGQRAGGPLMGQSRGNPARMLIERRAALELTDEQVTRLEELASQWDEHRAAARTQMQEFRQEARQFTAEQRQQMQAFRDQLRESGRAVQEGIRSTLTDEQRQSLGRRLDARARGMRVRGAMPGRAGRGRRGGVGPGAVAPRRSIGPRGPGAGGPPALLNRSGRGQRAPALAPRLRAPRGRIVLRLDMPLRGSARAIAPLRRRIRGVI